MKLIPSLLLALASLAGCTAAGGPFSSPQVDAAQLAQVRHGMTRDATLRLLGAPDEKMGFPLSRSEAWDYRYQDPWGYMASFSVTFGPDGTVVSHYSRRLNDGGDHSK
jgi:outer membrane protein assembly factor BamE (lipoprotein component of BamABCDE complex)